MKPGIATTKVEKMADSKKKVSAAQRKAADKYLEKFDEIRVRVPKGDKAVLQEHCKARNESVNRFIIQAYKEKMERDNTATE